MQGSLKPTWASWASWCFTISCSQQHAQECKGQHQVMNFILQCWPTHSWEAWKNTIRAWTPMAVTSKPLHPLTYVYLVNFTIQLLSFWPLSLILVSRPQLMHVANLAFNWIMMYMKHTVWEVYCKTRSFYEKNISLLVFQLQ